MGEAAERWGLFVTVVSPPDENEFFQKCDGDPKKAEPWGLGEGSGMEEKPAFWQIPLLYC